MMCHCAANGQAGRLPYFLSSHHKFQLRRAWDDPGFVRTTEEAADGFAAFLAVIERPVVHIHPHELIRELAAHVARVLKRVLHGFGAVLETETDAGSENI